MRQPLDLQGQRFGRLVAVELARTESNKGRGRHWLCQCDCGNTAVVRAAHLTSGHTVSCGCRGQEVRKETEKARAAFCAKRAVKKPAAPKPQQPAKPKSPKTPIKADADLTAKLKDAEKAMRAFRMDNLKLRVKIRKLEQKLQAQEFGGGYQEPMSDWDDPL